MPQERHNPYPTPTADEVTAWQAATDPATAAARNIMIRNIHGLMRRPFLRGDSDNAPILRGVRDLTEACWRLAVAIDEANAVEQRGMTPKLDAILDANAEMIAILEHHGCNDDGQADKGGARQGSATDTSA